MHHLRGCTPPIGQVSGTFSGSRELGTSFGRRGPGLGRVEVDARGGGLRSGPPARRVLLHVQGDEQSQRHAESNHDRKGRAVRGGRGGAIGRQFLLVHEIPPEKKTAGARTFTGNAGLPPEPSVTRALGRAARARCDWSRGEQTNGRRAPPARPRDGHRRGPAATMPPAGCPRATASGRPPLTVEQVARRFAGRRRSPARRRRRPSSSFPRQRPPAPRRRSHKQPPPPGPGDK